MSLNFTINGMDFFIDEFTDGFAWVNKYDEGDGFHTPCEAQQDAMRWVRERKDAETEEAEQDAIDRKYGTYEQQVYAYYRSII